MVVDGNVQEAPGVDQLARYGAVVRAWRRVAAWVVMRHDDSSRAQGDGEPEHFTRMHERAVQDPARDFLNPHNARLRVEHDHVEHFRQLLGGALAQEADRVLGCLDQHGLRLRRVNFLDETDPSGPQCGGPSTVWAIHVLLTLRYMLAIC